MKMLKINYKRLTTLAILLSFLIITIGCGGGAGGEMSGTVDSNDTGTDSIDSSGMSGTVGSNDPGTDSIGSNVINSANLSWDAPTTNADGTSLTDLAGYKVYYGTSSGDYTVSVDIGNSTGAIISSLEPGTWCFAVTAYDTSGNESDYSEETCKTI